MRVCVTGGRDWKDWRFVWRSLNEFELEYGQIVMLGHGCARGVDSFADEWAIRAGVVVDPYRADWERHGDSAGTRRNVDMLETFQPQFLLAFPGGTGTSHCVRHARKLGIERIFYAPVVDPIADLLRWG